MPPVHSALYYYIAIFKKKTKQCQKTQPPHIWFGKLWLHQFQITLQLFSQGRHLSAFLESSEFWILELGTSHQHLPQKNEAEQVALVFNVKNSRNSELHSTELHFFSRLEFKYSERTLEMCNTDKTVETFNGFSDLLFGYALVCLQVFVIN